MFYKVINHIKSNLNGLNVFWTMEKNNQDMVVRATEA